ncbi:MAG: uncharacterized protein H6Q66_2086 [Firmicutes bacterium]|nr:uncharacterized protein [Bacillota bacterium]
MIFETGLFLGKIPYIKSGAGSQNIVFFYGGSAFLMGLAESGLKNYLDVFQEYVPEGYTYYILGYEESPVRQYNLDQIADDFAQIVKEMGGAAAVVGISFGGFVAIRFAARYPEMTERLVLLISACQFSVNGKMKVDHMLDLANNEHFYDLIKEYRLLFRRPSFNWLAKFMIWKDKANILKKLKPSPAIQCSLAEIFSEDVYKNINYLREIRAKTLIIGGTRDQFFGVDEFKITAEKIPRAKLWLFENETHMLPIERKSDVSKIVKEFIAGS